MTNDLPLLTRADIARFIKDDRGVRAYDALQRALQNAGTDLSGIRADILTLQTLTESLRDVPYVTFATDPTLANQRVITAGPNIVLTDGGSTLTIGASQIPNATVLANLTGGASVPMPTSFAALMATFLPTLNPQTTSYVLTLLDGNGSTTVLMNLVGANTLTVPPNSSVAIPVGRAVRFVQSGAGTTTITPGAGVTLRTARTLTTRAQYSEGWMTQIAIDEWLVSGDLT